MTRRALVTGAGGFIGTRLVRRLLDDGWQVHALLRRALPDALHGVVAHPYAGTHDEVAHAVAAAAPDVTFHLASLYLADHRADQLADLVAANVLLVVQLAEALTNAGGGRLVNTGTGWQHHGADARRPVNLYAATKEAADSLLRYYTDARGLSLVTLKLFDTYGVGDPRRKLVQLLADTAFSGEALAMSPGEQTVDLTHVDDVVDAFTVAAGRLMAVPGAIDEAWFVSGERLTVRALADRVAAGLGRPVPATFGGRPYRAREVMMPVDPAGALLPDWRPRRTIETFLGAVAAAHAGQGGMT